MKPHLTMSTIVLILLLYDCAYALPKNSTGELSAKTIHQFPNGTWLENLALRSNSDIIAGTLSSPHLILVKPFASPGHNVRLLHTFPDVKGVLGITELRKDVFAVLAGNSSTVTFQSQNGSYSIWEVDVSHLDKKIKKNSGEVQVRKVTDVPESGFLNGATTLDKSRGLILIADSVLGVVWKADVRTGRYEIVLDEPEFKPVPTIFNGNLVVLGINGIKIRDGHLYFTNSEQQIFGRVAINADGTKRKGATVEVLARGIGGDDFTFDGAGNAWVTADAADQLVKITPDGLVVHELGSTTSEVLPGPTAAQFGRTKRDNKILYITTNGGIPGPINGIHIVGGKIAAVNTAS